MGGWEQWVIFRLHLGTHKVEVTLLNSVFFFVFYVLEHSDFHFVNVIQIQIIQFWKLVLLSVSVSYRTFYFALNSSPDLFVMSR